jgi:DNA-binding CsgD family transcriptional regulator
VKQARPDQAQIDEAPTDEAPTDEAPTEVSRPPRLEAVTEAIDTVQRMLSPPFMSSRERIPSFSAANRAIKAAWAELDRALADAGGGSGELLALAMRLHRADDVVRQMEAKKLSNSVDLVREALARFAGIDSVDQLVAECPRAICQLGFDRGMLSLVDKSVWTPASAHSEREPEWAHELVASGRRNPQTFVPTLPEFELVRRARSILVTDVEGRGKVYQEVVGASRSHSYVAAGVMSDRVLVGLLHADKYFQESPVDELDRSVLGLFAEAFGHVLAKAVAANRSAAIRSRLATLTADINSTASGLGHFHPEFTQDTPGDADRGIARPATTDTPLANAGLTPRETQVLALMAKGASNLEIGTRLFISNGTVKAHVKHILRKLGAANRAEAVSRWFNSGAGRI